MIKTRRLTLEDILSIKQGRTKTFLLNWEDAHIARQLVYNRKKKYKGCDIDVSVCNRILNTDEELYALQVTRKAYGITDDGFVEPKHYKKYDYSEARARFARKRIGADSFKKDGGSDQQEVRRART